MNFLSALGHGHYQPRAVCFAYDWNLLALYAVGDLAVMISTVIIALRLIAARNTSFQMSPQGRVLCGLFLFAVALSYLLRFCTLFVGIYRAEIFFLTLLAGLSLSLAF